MLYSARFVETLKVKATSLYNTRARKRWIQCLLLSFSAAPSCLFPHAVLPYPPRHFALPATPLHLIPHAVSPYPPRRFILSATPFCLIPNAILPYPPHHLALSPTPFCLIPHAISPYPTPFCLIRQAILPYPPRRFSLPLPLIPNCNCCKLGMMGINRNMHRWFLQPYFPLFNHR